jgi:vacuolar protein sorting-associated protein 13A/C
MWGSHAKSDSENGMSEAEKKEIDDIIDYDATAAEEPIGSTPRDYMQSRVSAKLNKGSFSLKVDPHGKNADIIALVFDSFSADAVQLTDSVSGKLALGGFRVYDGTTPGSLYPQIVRVKDIEQSSATRQKSLDVGGTGGALAEISDGMDENADTDPFFVMEVEHNPLDGRADNAVTVRMRHLEIIYHKGYVEAIYDFFKPPASQLESISALMDAAGQTLDGIRKETRAGLEYALEQHKTVDIRVDMNAPIIIIPMDVTARDSQALVLDAGHIAIESELADSEQLKEVRSKRGRQYSDEDYRQLEDLMYDKMSLRLESTQLLMGPDVDACMQALEEHHGAGQSELHILERINMSFSVKNAIVNTASITRFKIAGELPELQVNVSDRKYKNLMKFIDVAIPKFGDDEPQERAPQIIPADRKTQFRRHQQIEEYNLDDTRSILSGHTMADEEGSQDGKGVDQFYEAEDDTTESQRKALHQVTFEFTFSVGKLQASLFRSTSATTERALAHAVLENFGLTFELRQYDMSVDLFLRALTLGMTEEGQDEGLTRRPILSSANDTGNKELKLLKVRYNKVQKDSPEFMTVHEGVDQSVDVELSTFKIGIAPEPILSLYDFIMTTFVPPDEAPVTSRTTSTAAISEGESTDDAATVVEPVKSTDKIRVRVKLTSAQGQSHLYVCGHAHDP